MANIDSLEAMKKIDDENILQNIQEFPEQCERAWNDWKSIALPARFIQAKKILIAGMGGSGIGPGIAGSLAIDSRVPVIVWRDYGIPGWVDKDTLYIASSYSGNTEETVNSLNLAAAKTDKIITIASGGMIESLSRKYRTTHYKVNYGSPPRAALGFSLMSLVSIFSKLGLVDVDDQVFQEAVLLLKGLQKKIDVNMATGYNNAKLLAEKLEGKIPIIYGSGILSEVGRRWKQDFNENSKTASYSEILPEVNHNALVGLEFPKELRSKILTIILQSNFDHPRNVLRQSITAEVLQRRRIPYDLVKIEPAPTPLAELLQIILYGSYVSYYLAILNDISPTVIEMVDFLKDRLAAKPMDE